MGSLSLGVVSSGKREVKSRASIKSKRGLPLLRRHQPSHALSKDKAGRPTSTSEDRRLKPMVAE
jgi:hypothetical protein